MWISFAVEGQYAYRGLSARECLIGLMLRVGGVQAKFDECSPITAASGCRAR